MLFLIIYSEICNFFTALVVEGETIRWRNIACLDHPSAKDVMTGKFTFGEFEAAKPDILEATGTEKYNIGNKNVLYIYLL